MTFRIPVTSREYVRIPTAARENGAPVDPTDDTVELGFTPSPGDTPPNVWHTGSWETDGKIFYARCLIGPGTPVGALDAGEWDAWVRITDAPEQPVRKAGTFELT